jgi:hypothetical protein
MTWATLQTVLRGHLTAAGAAVTPAVPVVRLAGPATPQRQITCEYAGDDDNPYAGNTLAQRQAGEKLEIKVWVPVTSTDVTAAEAVETLLLTLKEEIRTRLYGDMNLGGNCMGLTLGPSVAAWEQWPTKEGVAILRTLTIPLTVGMADLSTISN